MQTRKLGYTGLYLTTMGFDTWAIGGARNPSQIEGPGGGADWWLAGAELAEIETLLADRSRTLDSV